MSSESPSRIKEEQPIARAKAIALTIAKASTISEECGREIFFLEGSNGLSQVIANHNTQTYLTNIFEGRPIKINLRELTRGRFHLIWGE